MFWAQSFFLNVSKPKPLGSNIDHLQFKYFSFNLKVQQLGKILWSSKMHCAILYLYLYSE